MFHIISNTFDVFIHLCTLADPGGGGARDVRPHSRSNFFHFHAVFGEKLAE